MSDSPRPKDNRKQSSITPSQLAEAMQKAYDNVETARDILARAHQVFDITRRLQKAAEEMSQLIRARRERQTEQASFHVPPIPQVASDILLITDNVKDIARFHYALEACGFPPYQRVLMERSDVEAVVRQAATAAPLSPPRLIITDCMIPGMEAEGIIAAVRTVPVYQRIPVMLFSALDADEGERRRVQCGATAFVHKSNKLEDFVTAVSTMVLSWGGVGDSSDLAAEREARHDEEREDYKTDTE